MKRFISKINVAAVLTVALLGIGGCDKPAEKPSSQAITQEKQTQPEKFTLQLHWIPDSHQLGFWIALDKGMYKKDGLDVTIRPGGLDANPIKDVLGGSADVGQVGGIEQAATAVSEDLPLKAIASIHRDTPHALISLASKPIRNPADFKGKTIAVAYGDTAEILLKSYMAEAGIPAAAVKLVPFKFDLTPLLSGQVDAITGFSTAQPVMIEKLGKTPVILSYSSAGVSSYGYTLLAANNTLTTKQAALTKFIQASREGWEYAFSHPDEAISLFKKRFGDSVDIQQSQRELELIKPLMLNKDGTLSTWKLEETRVAGVLGYLQKQGQLKKAIPAASLYDNSYTP